MTVRYTAMESMDAGAISDVDLGDDRNVERWREKIEVRLDNRQVFFLFFGSAVVACMLFVLGVIVGKRIESRGQAAAPVVTDPLAVLDRASQPVPAAGAPAHDDLAFPKTLIAAPTPSKGRAPRPVAVAKAPAPAAPKPPAPVAAAPKPTPPPPAPADPAKAAKGKYTLHLATLPTRDEADALAKKYAGQGAFVIAVDVPEKGTVYRVRCGNYASFKDATAAKTAFEKTNNAIAFVAAR
jgi:cell division protein FtsN